MTIYISKKENPYSHKMAFKALNQMIMKQKTNVKKSCGIKVVKHWFHLIECHFYLNRKINAWMQVRLTGSSSECY